MHVVVTAGHVDHGKTTLVDTLTGMCSDRLPEERRRNVSIELGHVWTRLDGVGDVAFVDVPGHERYIATTLRGIAPARVAMLVVAADDPFMPQAEEHVAALSAFDIEHGVAVITKCDLADPVHLRQSVARRLAGTSLAGAAIVEVSARTGAGLDHLRDELARVLATMPTPAAHADVRFWIDRQFVVKGRGTVVTGTLAAGTITADDALRCGADLVRVRAIHSLGRDVGQMSGPARVALNLVGRSASDAQPGRVLTTPDAWPMATMVDVRLDEPSSGLVRKPMLHIGTCGIQVDVRPLDDRHARVRIPVPVPLRPGDRAVLRAPGDRSLTAVEVLDPLPPPSPRRRGWVARRARQLQSIPRGGSSLESELDRRGYLGRETRSRLGFETSPAPAGAVEVPGFLLGAALADRARSGVDGCLSAVEAQGLPPHAATIARLLGLPSVDALRTLCAPGLRIVDGLLCRDVDHPELRLLESRIRDLAPPGSTGTLHHDAAALERLGISRVDMESLVRTRALFQAADNTYVSSPGVAEAIRRLRGLGERWSVSEARVALHLSRAATMRLLAHLEDRGAVVRHDDDRRSCVAAVDG